MWGLDYSTGSYTHIEGHVLTHVGVCGCWIVLPAHTPHIEGRVLTHVGVCGLDCSTGSYTHIEGRVLTHVGVCGLDYSTGSYPTH